MDAILENQSLETIAKFVMDNVRSEERIRRDILAGECRVRRGRYPVSFEEVSFVFYNDGKEYHRNGREFQTREFIAFLDYWEHSRLATSIQTSQQAEIDLTGLCIKAG